MKGDNRIQMFPRAIEGLVENLNSTTPMIPHVYTSVDDGATVRSILNRVGNKSKLRTTKNEYTCKNQKRSWANAIAPFE
jgi:hypothetical protein